MRDGGVTLVLAGSHSHPRLSTTNPQFVGKPPTRGSPHLEGVIKGTPLTHCEPDRGYSGLTLAALHDPVDDVGRRVLAQKLHLVEMSVPEAFAELEEFFPQAEYLVSFENLTRGAKLTFYRIGLCLSLGHSRRASAQPAAFSPT
jgi:hypothetical protein